MGDENENENTIDIRTSYASLDEIPETVADFRSLFSERGGKFELTLPGVKTQGDIDRQQEALMKERTAHKATKAKLEVWGELNHDDVVSGLDRIPELEAAAGDKLDDAGIEEIVGKRVDGTLRAKIAPLERELKKARQELEELTVNNLELSADALRRSREDVLRPLLVKAHVFPEYHDDALLYAERHLEKSAESGGFFAREGIQGMTSGSTPGDWLAEMIERRPGWIPAAKGAGARGSGSGGGFTGKNPFTREAWNMTAQGQLVQTKGTEYAEKLAAAAGTSVGGLKPPKKG